MATRCDTYTRYREMILDHDHHYYTHQNSYRCMYFMLPCCRFIYLYINKGFKWQHERQHGGNIAKTMLPLVNSVNYGMVAT